MLENLVVVEMLPPYNIPHPSPIKQPVKIQLT